MVLRVTKLIILHTMIQNCFLASAKCFSSADPQGQKFKRDFVRKTPVFVKGVIKNYQGDASGAKFDIEVASVLKGKNVPNVIHVNTTAQPPTAAPISAPSRKAIVRTPKCQNMQKVIRFCLLLLL